MRQWRLVRQYYETLYWDVPVPHNHYILQYREDEGVWETVPIVRFDDLSEQEQTALQRQLEELCSGQ